MIAAAEPIQRPSQAKLLVVSARGEITHAPRAAFVEFLRPGDLMIANDAATLPASLRGEHVPSGGPVEVRLSGRRSLAPDNVRRFSAVVFGAGDYRTRTEDRSPPPPLQPGDRLALGPLSATVERLLGHPRLVALRFAGPPDAIWAGLARHGRPIQYAHVPAPLALWDVWTPVAGPPVAFEPPSAGFALDWRALAALRNRVVAFATLTHAAGLSSTGDAELDRRLPFDEPYRIPPATAVSIRRVRARGGRVVAVGTTVVRALEHAASCDGRVWAGDGLATQRIGAATHLRVVDAILTGTHERGTSHHELLQAFTDDATLGRVNDELSARGYRTHEFGDSVLIERNAGVMTRGAGASRREVAQAGRLVESGAIATAGRTAQQQADRISFNDLGRRREEIDRALPEGGDLAAALSSDQTYQALLKRRDALRRWQGELDGLANRKIEHEGRTPSRSDPCRSDEASGSDALAPRSSPGDKAGAEAARGPRRQAAGLVKNALYLLVGIAATGGFAAYVQETQVNRPFKDSNPQALTPDHQNVTGVWLHPVLYDSLKYHNNINFLSNADKLGEFLAERGLSFSGPLPVLRIEITYSFDDPNVQAEFGLRFSNVWRDPDQIVDILSTLCDAKDKSSFISNLRDVPLYRQDMANLPEPTDLQAFLDLEDRRQSFGMPRPDSWRERGSERGKGTHSGAK